MFCDQCGNQCKVDAKFCGKCGFRFDNIATSQGTPPPTQPAEPVQLNKPTPPPIQQAPPPVQQAPPPVQQAPPPVQQAPPPVQQAPAYTAPPEKSGNQLATVLITVAVCAVMLGGAGGAYYLGSQSNDDSSSSSSRYEESTPVTQAPSDTTSSESTTKTDVATSDSSSAPSTSTDTTTSSSSTTMEVPPAPTYDTPTEPVNNDYILPDSSTRYLTNQELHTSGLTSDELALARNEIYARHGRQFNNEGYQAWFDSKTWYQNIYPKYAPTVFDSLNPSPLSAIELANIQTIKEVESVYGNVPS